MKICDLLRSSAGDTVRTYIKKRKEEPAMVGEDGVSSERRNVQVKEHKGIY